MGGMSFAYATSGSAWELTAESTPCGGLVAPALVQGSAGLAAIPGTGAPFDSERLVEPCLIRSHMKLTPATTTSIRAVILVFLVFGLTLLVVPVRAQATPNPPERMTYQGFLVGSDGVALGNSAPKNYDVIFKIYDDQLAGDLLWAEQQTVTVDKGYFSVLLGEGASTGEPRPALSTLFKGASASDRFVGITVRGIGSSGSNVDISPRLRLVSSPYSFLAENAVKLVQTTGADLITSSGNAVTVNGPVSSASVSTTGNIAAGGSVTATGALSGHSLTVGAATAGAVTAASVTASGAVSADSVTAAGAISADTVSATTLSGFGTIPVGGIIMWSGVSVPTGWALCNGGTSNGRQTPDLRGRFVLASGAGSGLTARTLGQTGGAETHQLTVAEMPAHTHSFRAFHANFNHEGGASEGSTKNDGDGSFTDNDAVGSTGGGQPHSIMPPFYVLAFIMRVR